MTPVELIALAASTSLLIASSAATSPEIRVADVDRFYAVYESASGKPTAAQLDQDYLAKASPGLIEFAKLRRITGERMAAAIGERPEVFENARQCATILPAATVRIADALARLHEVYPRAAFPPVTVAIGRGKPVGVANASGVMIGLEAFCAADVFKADLEGSFVHLVAHEYAHVLQPAAQVEHPNDPVLKAALIEGGAEFIAELISGSVSSRHLAAATKGREKELETAFLEDVDKKALGSRWLYNGWGTAEWPGDLGYWVGYRIAKSYYLHAKDKKAAVREIIEFDDPKAFLAKSGWQPGMMLN